MHLSLVFKSAFTNIMVYFYFIILIGPLFFAQLTLLPESPKSYALHGLHTPLTVPLRVDHLHLHLTHGSFSPHDTAPQTASRSV